MNIQPIVEGHGEVEAVPVLLRKLRDIAQTYPLEINGVLEQYDVCKMVSFGYVSRRWHRNRHET